MSPEVLRGNGYGFKSDIWSLGCVLYEMAMLRSPFKSEGLNLYGLFQKISKGDYTELPNVYSETLRNLAYRMISVDVSLRPDIQEVCRIALAERDRTAAAQSAQAAPAGRAPAKEAQTAVAAPQAGSKDDKADSRKSVAAEAVNAAMGQAEAEAKVEAASPVADRGNRTSTSARKESKDDGDTTRTPPAKQPRAARAAVGGAGGAVDMFAMAEDIHAKLQLLNYDGEAVERLGPVYFAMEMSGCVNPRSRYEQFTGENAPPPTAPGPRTILVLSHPLLCATDMLAIASWLLSSLDRPTDLNAEEMQPSQVSSSLLVAAQKAGVPSSVLSGKYACHSRHHSLTLSSDSIL
jgi:hypothetical protein